MPEETLEVEDPPQIKIHVKMGVAPRTASLLSLSLDPALDTTYIASTALLCRGPQVSPTSTPNFATRVVEKIFVLHRPGLYQE